jgi:hypothetical protein
MTTCSALLCTNPGTSFVMVMQTSTADFHDVYVCDKHRVLMDAGSPWDMHGRHILIGQDMAPPVREWSARPSGGAEGFTLTMRFAGGIEPVDAFLVPKEARKLAAFIYSNYGEH